MKIKNDGTWKFQDLKMARVLKEYGFTSIYRASETKLLAAFDNGTYAYEIPWISFMFLEVGITLSIDTLINLCEANCK